MYFNDKKEDTNIDDEFEEKRLFDFRKLKLPLIILGIIIVVIVLISILANRDNRLYFITLTGEKEITLVKGEKYEEPGYQGYDNHTNDLTDKVTIKSNVDTSKVGTYTITYTLKDTSVTRTITVLEEQNAITYIYLKGDKNITLKVGEKYEEPGYSAIDSVDGDITSNVTIENNVDTSKQGTYKVIYTVINSHNIKTSETRIIIVK